MRRTVRTMAALAVVGLLGTGCLGGSNNNQPSDPNRGAGATDVALTITANAATGAGAKNAAEADWIQNWVIPKFTEQQQAKGVKVTVRFQPTGVDDEQYKQRIVADLQTGSGADVVSVDGIWVGELAEAGYIKPLDETAGAGVNSWEGWGQIAPAVQQIMTFDNKRYGVPFGTDGRVLFYNKTLFRSAGLPADWQPKTWEEIFSAAQKLKQLPGVTPLQINAGTAMGEATTMQGFLPLLVGTGQQIYNGTDSKWLGNTKAVRDVLGFYQRVYGSSGYGDATLQQEAKGRDKSFEEFSKNKIGILAESDYFWRSVVEPSAGQMKMKDRDTSVGYALIPAMRPGQGVRKQDFVSMSGGSGRVINPATKFPQQAWELLAFMNSADAYQALLQGNARITPRNDVNAETLRGDPMLTFVAEKVLPVTVYRPGLAVYPQVSQALQQATLDVVTGKTPEQAAATYGKAVEKIVGGSSHVTSG